MFAPPPPSESGSDLAAMPGPQQSTALMSKYSMYSYTGESVHSSSSPRPSPFIGGQTTVGRIQELVRHTGKAAQQGQYHEDEEAYHRRRLLEQQLMEDEARRRTSPTPVTTIPEDGWVFRVEGRIDQDRVYSTVAELDRDLDDMPLPSDFLPAATQLYFFRLNFDVVDEMDRPGAGKWIIQLPSKPSLTDGFWMDSIIALAEDRFWHAAGDRIMGCSLQSFDNPKEPVELAIWTRAPDENDVDPDTGIDSNGVALGRALHAFGVYLCRKIICETLGRDDDDDVEETEDWQVARHMETCFESATTGQRITLYVVRDDRAPRDLISLYSSSTARS